MGFMNTLTKFFQDFHISSQSRNSNSAADLFSLSILFYCKRCSLNGFAAAIAFNDEKCIRSDYTFKMGTALQEKDEDVL